MDFLQVTVYLSLFVQVVTGFFDYYVIQLNIPSRLQILKEVLIMELLVQIVEGIFYVWLAWNITNVVNITPHRYYDWYITTPTMLISLCVYLVYLRNEENNKETTESFFEVIYNNLGTLSSIVVLNFFMLTFGLLTELKKMSKFVGVFFGFIPFVLYFYIIYEYFAKYSALGTRIFFYFFFIWALYGVAALLSYRTKNILYSILDLFAKNFFGLYLGFVILKSL